MHVSGYDVPTQWQWEWFVVRPDCTTECLFPSSANECSCGHDKIIHVPLNNSGDYFVFPALTWHWGYYNDQLFCTIEQPDKDYWLSHQLLKENHVIQLESIDAAILVELQEDLLKNWDKHYSTIKFLPPRNYKLNKVLTNVNHVVKEDSF